MSNDKFRQNISKRVNKAQDKLELSMRRFMMDAMSRMVQKSPVDTGRFKGNWNVGNGTINYSVNMNAKGSPAGMPDNYNNMALNALRLNGQTIYLTNALPYARELEDGHSRIQAPMGMVGVTIAELTPIMTKVAIEVRAL